MNLLDEITNITDRLKKLSGRIDKIDFQNTRYRNEIKYFLTLKPELKDFFSDATKKEAGVYE